jgi:hypothetical protein
MFRDQDDHVHGRIILRLVNIDRYRIKIIA